MEVTDGAGDGARDEVDTSDDARVEGAGQSSGACSCSSCSARSSDAGSVMGNASRKSSGSCVGSSARSDGLSSPPSSVRQRCFQSLRLLSHWTAYLRDSGDSVFKIRRGDLRD